MSGGAHARCHSTAGVLAQEISMAAMQPHLIAVAIRRDESGWFIATSADCPGLVVADPDRQRVVELVPEAIELLYDARRHQRVRVVRLSHPDNTSMAAEDPVPFAAIPEDSVAVGRSR
jgi:hypothetical protein